MILPRKERKEFLSNNTEKENTSDNRFSKKMSKTVYQVTVHFSEKSKETLQDKIHRLIKNDYSNTGK